jgi:hypothetical protein
LIPESVRSETSGDETGPRGDSGESRSSEGRSRDGRGTGKAAGQRSGWVSGTHRLIAIGIHTHPADRFSIKMTVA